MSNDVSRTRKRFLKQLENDAQAVLDHAPSMRFICRMMAEMRFDVDAFASDPHVTSHNLGKQAAMRNIVVALQSVDPEAHVRLLRTVAATRREIEEQATGETDDD